MKSLTCPRCGGNLLPDTEDGIKCLQCCFIPKNKEEIEALVKERNEHHGNYLIGWRFKRNGVRNEQINSFKSFRNRVFQK